MRLPYSPLPLIILPSILLIGCASPLPILEANTAPKQNSGYVTGMFSGNGSGFGLQLTNIKTNVKYLVPFYGTKSWVEIFKPDTHEDEVTMVEVPEGGYIISHWVVYAMGNHERILEKEFPSSKNKPIIEIQSGKVKFIGHYKASMTFPEYRTVEYRITPIDIVKSDFIDAFSLKYPMFQNTIIDF